MRKMVFVLVIVMLSTPAWADIAITATDLGGGVVDIDYSGTELARAFALDITVDAGTISAISDFAIGDDNNGYGIFPANFSRYINVDPESGLVTDWSVNGYTPVADANDPGALGGIGTNGITIEMGSLYDTKAPPLEGKLCAVTCSEQCRLTVTTNALRGNVVLEDATEAIVNLDAATDVQIAGDTAYTGPQPAQWEEVGKPDCWVSSINPRQCYGDVDGASQGKNKYWVGTNDLNVLIAAWNKPFSEIDGQTEDGIPLICADIDHLALGKNKYRVSTYDLDILIANWQIVDGPDANCP